MYLFNKFPHYRNFEFAASYHNNSLTIGNKPLPVRMDQDSQGVLSLQIKHPKSGWQTESRIPKPNEISRENPVGWECKWTGQGAFHLFDEKGKMVLESASNGAFGLSGESWMFQFRQTGDMQFFGLGEKAGSWLRNGSYWFWNVDVWADIPAEEIKGAVYEPDYISIPYLIIRKGKRYIGILLDNTRAGFISISPKHQIANQLKSTGTEEPVFQIGSESGSISLRILTGSTLAELTRKVQMLTGPSPRPPIWALGHHQCKWGYRNCKDLKKIAAGFEKSRIPNDGLWLDIDYMDGYRVFTFSDQHFDNPAKEIAGLQKRGYHVIPIIDPGVKQEKNYPVYESGKVADVFCKNPQGGDFIGIVWPGYTVFPDFSLEKAVRWWSNHVAEFAKNGFEGVWVDMNDPATGPVDCHAMLFQNGKQPHETFHNQYAGLMSKATKQGLEKAWPNKRVFVLSRSGDTGSQQWAANWTGDNFSNYAHLKQGIVKSLALSLCGMPFNGPDVGGFGGDCYPQLMSDWIRAGFLFPFLRNHSLCTSRPQEPWELGESTKKVYKHYVQLRYKLLPYLYNLFIQSEQQGDPVLRPLMYHFTSASLASVADQFLVGGSIMQAPFLEEKKKVRKVVLPPGNWFEWESGKWIKGSRTVSVRRTAMNNPIYIKDGSIIPMQSGWSETNKKNLFEIDLFLFISNRFKNQTHYTYIVDDCETLNYQKGEQSRFFIAVKRQNWEVIIEILDETYDELTANFTPVTTADIEKVTLVHNGEIMNLNPKKMRENFAGKRVDYLRWR